jgi:hypothetical protein
MLYIDTRIVDSSEAILAEGAQVTQEGQAMVAVPGKGISPSTGAANEIFAGFAMNQLCGIPVLEPYGIAVEEFLVDSSAKVTVQFAPISNSVALINLETDAAIASPTVTGKTIAATAMTAGMKVKVVYRYALTNIQARAMMGDAQPGGPAGAIVGQCGLAKRGIIYTSCFDTSVNWAAATAIKLASGGFITDQSGTGTTLTGAYVVKVPTAEIPFLGIEFSAA